MSITKQLLIILLLLPIVLFIHLVLDLRRNYRYEDTETLGSFYKEEWGEKSQPKKIEKTEFDKILEKYTTNPNSK